MKQMILFIRWLFKPANFAILLGLVNEVQVILSSLKSLPHPLWGIKAFQEYAEEQGEKKLEALKGTRFMRSLEKTSRTVNYGGKEFYLFLHANQLLDHDLDDLKGAVVRKDDEGNFSLFFPEEGVEVEFEEEAKGLKAYDFRLPAYYNEDYDEVTTLAKNVCFETFTAENANSEVFKFLAIKTGAGWVECVGHPGEPEEDEEDIW